MRHLITLLFAITVVGCAATSPPPPATPPAPRTDATRVPLDRFLFGVCYYPEQWSKDYWERDARRMRECGVNTVRMGEFAWALMEPEEGRFDFRWLDEAIEVLARQGIRTILGTPTATPPKWLTHKYPDVLHVFENGRAADDQSRRHYCYNSPRYRALCRRVVEAMAAHYRDNPNVIGWQIDNEINNENKACFSDNCRGGFQEWLKRKYGGLGALNERWGTVFWSQTYTAWRQIGLPAPTPAYHNPALVLDHRRFVSDSATSFLEEQVAIIRRHRPNDWITHNGIFRGIDYYRFAKSLDLYAQDSYPTFLDEPRFPTAALLTAARSFNGRMMIMEELTGPAGQTYLLRTPAPGQARFWAMQTIAHGADGVIHFRWRSARRGAEQYWTGVLDHDDVTRGRYDEFRQEGHEIERIGREVLGSTVPSGIAIINDYEAEWAYDHQYFTDEVNPKSGVHMRADLIDLFRAASERGYNVDFIPPDADLGKYKLVFAPRLLMADAALADRIRRFVEAGGTFVAATHSGVKDRDNAVTDRTPPGPLADVFGVTVEAFQCYQPKQRETNELKFDDGKGVPVYVFADVLNPRADGGAKVVATWDRDFLAGKPACTERAAGNGKAIYYGSFLNLDAARYLLQRYATSLGLKPLLRQVPDGIEVTTRTKGKTSFYFILNHGPQPAAVELEAGFFDLLAGKDAPERLTIDSYDYRVLRTTARRPGG